MKLLTSLTLRELSIPVPTAPPKLSQTINGWTKTSPNVPIHSWTLSIKVAAPLSMRFPKTSLNTVGCMFAEGVGFLAKRKMHEEGKNPTPATSPEPAPLTSEVMLNKTVPEYKKSNQVIPTSQTRILPPKDIVKLEDRLQYLLQPPLESLLSAEALHFPFHPFDYQFDGIAFLYPRHQAVIADEMGLGKTMQAISAIRLLAHQGHIRRVLIICPKPLITNWQRELSLWAPEIAVTTISGKQSRRYWQWQTNTLVTIANYETVVRDAEIVSDESNHYDLVLLDESQRIKNRHGTTSNVIRSINRSRSWAMTGTPIEHSLQDLVGIFDFVSPGYLNPTMKPRLIGEAVNDFVLRRTKDKVFTDMPPILYRDAHLDLSPEQNETYRLAEDEGIVHLNELRDSLTVTHVFELILRLKQICNFDPVTGESSKIERLEADLEECVASGQKAIIFSQWVKTIEKLSDKLKRFNPVEFHGKIPNNQRDAQIEKFRNDPNCSVIIMSYGAGSVGLNLQFANYVFLYDRWWNPAVEDQAINRAHRIGVKGAVTVTRFISNNTIEQRIDQILEEKRELFKEVFEGATPAQSLGFSSDEIFSLFNLHSPKGPIRGVA